MSAIKEMLEEVSEEEFVIINGPYDFLDEIQEDE